MFFLLLKNFINNWRYNTLYSVHEKRHGNKYRVFQAMGGGGFEPPKQFAADLQSVPFGHSGIHPYSIIKYNRQPMNGLEPLTC